MNFKNNIIQTASGNDYDKVLKVHDTLANILEYETTISGVNIHNIYGALKEKKCVCEGYAKALKYILDSMNIPCILVSGIATNTNGTTESHMWNYVKLDGNWYGVDVTWDDPVTSNGTDMLMYDYYLIDTNTLLSKDTTQHNFNKDIYLEAK